MKSWKLIALDHPEEISSIVVGNWESRAQSILNSLREKGAMKDAWAIAKYADSIGSFEVAATIRRGWMGWILEKDESGNYKLGDSTVEEAVMILQS